VRWRRIARLARLAPLACGLAIGACAPDGAVARRDGPAASALRLVGETVLQESESLYVGRPIGLTIGRDGSYYVSDLVLGRVVRFAADGRLVGAIGRKGRGPGELVAPSRSALLADTLLVVTDNGRGQLSVFDARSGRHRFDVRVDSTASVLANTLAVRHDTVWMGARDLVRRTGVAMWTLRDRGARALVRFPELYRIDRAIAANYGHVQVVPLGDSLLVSFLASPRLLLTDLDGRVLRAVELPVVRRRGIPADISRRYRESPTLRDKTRLLSMLLDARRLGSGAVVVVNFDLEMPEDVPLRTGYVSLLSRDLRSACVDLPLPLSQDGMANVAFRGDTLVTLEQEVVELGVRVVSRRYVIDERACAWQPLVRHAVEDGAA